MTKKNMLIGVVVLLVLGFGAVLLMTTSQLVSTYQRSERDHAKAPAPTLLLTPANAAASEAALTTAVAGAPADPAALTRLGDFYMTNHAFAKAVTTYRKATTLDPAYAVGWSALGEAYVQSIPSTRTQLPPEARDAFDRAIAADPNDLRARFYLAMEKDFVGAHDDAMNDWIKMLAMVPMGSQADNAIRAAITASMGRNVLILRRRVDDAMRAQKKLKPLTT